MKENNIVLKDLFQQQFSKMVAVISNLFGLQHIEIAEDIVSETFLQATENWQTKGLPPNPAAWLYAVAKQKTLYYFRRKKIFDKKIAPSLKTTETATEEITEIDFSQQNIKDSQLRMMFAVCDPVIAGEAQIGLALRILCGFGIDEVAEAFFTNKETIMKRLYRAKEKLRTENIKLQMPPEHEIDERLKNVLHILYLLFNEGYYSTTQNQQLRKDLCLQALQLGLSLTEYEPTNQPKTNAIIALMCFHASRFDARFNKTHLPVDYEEQDEKLWNKDLVREGCYYLALSAQGSEISSYHLEARIAFCHCIKKDRREKWEEILHLYNQLVTINYSPSVALSRTFALYKVYGAEMALQEAEKLKLESNAYYYLLLGELYKNIDSNQSVKNYARAFRLVKTETERHSIEKKIRLLK